MFMVKILFMMKKGCVKGDKAGFMSIIMNKGSF